MPADDHEPQMAAPTRTVALLPQLLAVALLVVLIALAVLDPIRFDGWYHWIDRRHNPLTWSVFVDAVTFTYNHANPRSGQFATIAVYGESLLLTFLICSITLVAAFWLVAAIALGRPPRRGDGALLATMLAIGCVCVPQFGPVLTYKPYLTNYVTGALPGLALLAAASMVVHRAKASQVVDARKRPVESALASVVALAVGVAAGMGNEHLGPALCSALAAAIYLSHRQRALAIWLIPAFVGVAVGTFFLLTAPGQSERYGGIGNVGVVATVLNRHPLANVAIALAGPALILGAAPWFLLARRRPAGTMILASLGFALITGLVTMGSPKLGTRLLFVPAALIAGAAAVALGEKGRFAARHLTAGVLAVSIAGMLWTNLRQFSAYERRFALVSTAQQGSVLLVPPIPRGFPQWTLRDDFRNRNIVKILTGVLGLERLELSSAER